MRCSIYIAAFMVVATAWPISDSKRSAKLFKVELAPGQIREVTEAEKFALIDVRKSWAPNAV